MATRIAVILTFLFVGKLGLGQSLLPNSGFEQGTNAMCHCPDGYECGNDATRVEDGVHPVFVVGDEGCIHEAISYTNVLGAKYGAGYVYFYAGADYIETLTPIYFSRSISIDLCVWYAGPKDTGALGQNTPDSHFYLMLDGAQVGPDVLVPVNTGWTRYCQTLNISAGSHKFGIHSGGIAQYSIWFDGFTVTPLCQYPVIELGDDTLICSASSYTLDATTVQASYLWQDSSTNATLTIDSSGSYWVEVTNNCGTVRDSIYVDLLATRDVLNSNYLSLCIGDTIELDATGFNTSYQWQDTTIDPKLIVIEAGLYWVETTNACGTFRDSVIVDFATDLTIDLGNDTVLCSGETLDLYVSTDTGVILDWNDSSNDPFMTIDTSGIYWVKATNSCGTYSDSISVEYISAPHVDIGNDTALFIGDTLKLINIDDNAEYLWQNDANGSWVIIEEAGIHWVKASNTCGTSRDSVIVNLSDKACNIYVPNAFSPNNDGNNDVFEVYSVCQLFDYHLMVFNRWGEKVFDSTDPALGWNGEHNGIAGQVDVYVYVVQFKYDLENSTHIKKGSVMLIR